MSINMESVQALREFADKLPYVTNNMQEQTEHLMTIYNSVADKVGVHEQDFLALLMTVKKAEEFAAEAIEQLSPMLRQTADKMEIYINQNPKENVVSGEVSKVKETVDFQVKNNEVARKRKKCKVIGSFCNHDVGKYKNVIGDEGAGLFYEKFQDNIKDYEYIERPILEQNAVFVNPNFIEGVTVEAPSPSGIRGVFNSRKNILTKEQFWEMNRAGYDRYMELASHIPEINQRINKLPPEQREQELRSLRMHPELGNCVLLYFTSGPGQMIETSQADGIWVFHGDGRHRILAARDVMENAREKALQDGVPFHEEDYYIPTTVKGSYVNKQPNKNNPAKEDDLYKSNESKTVNYSSDNKGVSKLSYYHELKSKIRNCPNRSAVSIWNKYEDQIKIGNSNYKGVAHCLNDSPTIFVNGEMDKKGSYIHNPYQVTIHEAAHAIDLINSKNGIGPGKKFSSSYQNGKFSKTILNEVNEWINAVDRKICVELKAHKDDYEWLKEKGYIDEERYQYYIENSAWIDGIAAHSRIFAYKSIENEIRSIPLRDRANLSDILEGATHEKVKCGVGHGKENGISYWDENNINLASEAFAEMFDSTFANQKSLEVIKNICLNPTQFLKKCLEKWKNRR